MMTSDFGRLTRDLSRDEQLYQDLEQVGTSPERLDRWLQGRSYRLTAEEVARVASGLGEELSDEDLEHVSGGGGDSLALQNTLDRRSRLLSTLSNIMSGMDGTSDTLIDNMK